MRGAAHTKPWEVRALYEEQLTGRHDHGRKLWLLLNLELWLRMLPSNANSRPRHGATGRAVKVSELVIQFSG